MPKNTRELIRVGLPIPLDRWNKIVEAIDPAPDATIRHLRGSLVIEEPATTELPLEEPAK